MIFDRNGETASDKADESKISHAELVQRVSARLTFAFFVEGHSNIVAMLRVLIQRQRGEDLGYVTP